jgi:mevalonate kinase
MTTASAPGKVILFGEHAVVYGRPALAAPVTQLQATASVTANPDGGFRIEAPDIELSAPLESCPPDHPIAAAVLNGFSALGIPSGEALTLHIRSTIPVAAGLGSGTAVTVAILRALSSHLGQDLNNEEISALAYEVEKLHHGTPSGIDNTVITYEQPVCFQKGQPIERLNVRSPFTIIIGDTGLRSSTRVTVASVRDGWQAEPSDYERIFDQVGRIVQEARQAIEQGANHELGPLMNANQVLLTELGVSCQELDALITAANVSGALGAKLSGGGRGGNMIALAEADQEERVIRAIEAAGAKTVITTQVE